MNTRKLILFTLLLVCFNARGQNDSTKTTKPDWDYEHKNVGKVGLTATIFNNVSLSYERSFRPKWTVGLNAGYLVKTGIPNVFGLDSTSISVSTDGIKGFSLTPDLRYYIKSCENQSPNGFYAAFYLKYAHYYSGMQFNYFPDFPDTELVEYIRADIGYSEFGLGLMIGYQLLIKERFIIDFIIIGPRKSRVTMNYEFDDSISEEFLTDLESNLQDIIDRFGFDHEVKLETSGNRQANYSFNLNTIRFGISLGFAF